MTEQEKAFGRKFIVGTLVAMFALICLAGVWQKLNEPMQPIVIEFGDRYYVRWGNRFQPFVYESLIYADVRTLRIGDRVFRIEDDQIYRQTVLDQSGDMRALGWELIDELPPDAHRRMFEGKVLLDSHLRPERLKKT